MWKVKVFTLFPELYPGPLGVSVLGRAIEEQKISIEAFDIRDYALDKHKTVDDTPYGGGGGMVMKADVIAAALDAECRDGAPIYYLSPRGKVFNQKMAHSMASSSGAHFICGRFEGVDERLFLEYDIRQLSLGDFVLSSGDVALYSVIDACARLIPGVLDEKKALLEESFAVGSEYESLLEYPHYTKPSVWRGHEVPEVLRRGNHAEISRWRFERALEKTRDVRPELLLDRCTKGGL